MLLETQYSWPFVIFGIIAVAGWLRFHWRG